MPHNSLTLTFQAKLKHHFTFFTKRYYYLIITCSRHHTEVGRTETIHSLQPSWTTHIIFNDYTPNINQYINVELYNKSSSDFLLGSTTFHLQESLQKTSNGQQLEEKMNSNLGTILLFTEPYYECHGTITVQLRCVNVKNMQHSLLGLSRSDPFFIIYKKRFYPLIGITRWQAIYRSNYIKNHHHPIWKEFTIGLHQLFDGKKDNHSIKMELYDHHKNGNHKLIGELETSVNMLEKSITCCGNADLKKAIDFCDRRKNNRGVRVAQMVVLKFDIRNDI